MLFLKNNNNSNEEVVGVGRCCFEKEYDGRRLRMPYLSSTFFQYTPFYCRIPFSKTTPITRHTLSMQATVLSSLWSTFLALKIIFSHLLRSLCSFDFRTTSPSTSFSNNTSQLRHLQFFNATHFRLSLILYTFYSFRLSSIFFEFDLL